MATIGILALQGAFAEHKSMIQQLGHTVVEIRHVDDLKPIHGLILPGGESTTISKLLMDFELFEPIKIKIEQGLPVLGTCAGLILLAKDVENDSLSTLGVMDIQVKRNAYGRQVGSFMVEEMIKEISPNLIPLVFIRAPYISAAADHVQILHRVNNHIVAVREKNMLGISFHPELTKDTAIHEYFIQMID